MCTRSDKPETPAQSAVMSTESCGKCLNDHLPKTSTRCRRTWIKQVLERILNFCTLPDQSHALIVEIDDLENALPFVIHIALFGKTPPASPKTKPKLGRIEHSLRKYVLKAQQTRRRTLFNRRTVPGSRGGPKKRKELNEQAT